MTKQTSPVGIGWDKSGAPSRHANQILTLYVDIDKDLHQRFESASHERCVIFEIEMPKAGAGSLPSLHLSTPTKELSA